MNDPAPKSKAVAFYKVPPNVFQEVVNIMMNQPYHTVAHTISRLQNDCKAVFKDDINSGKIVRDVPDDTENPIDQTQKEEL